MVAQYFAPLIASEAGLALTGRDYKRNYSQMEFENFHQLLIAEFKKRKEKNSSYSLRSYARFLGIYHGTLSSLLSGKRPLTAATVKKIAVKLGVNAERFMRDKDFGKKTQDIKRVLLGEDVFARISLWYFDAIIELSKIQGMQMTADSVAKYFGLSKDKAKDAIHTLIRLGLLVETKKGFQPRYFQSTNLESAEQTSVAMREYQKSILEKSLESLQTVDRKDRDHTSITLAIRKKDLARVKELIGKFRQDLNIYLQGDETNFDEVYQLQIGFFPLKKND